MTTYPLIGEVVHSGATYRDFIRHHDQADSVRLKVIRPCGPAYPEHYWITEVIQSQDRRWMGMTVIVSEGHVYKQRTNREAAWAGMPVGAARPVPWILRPEDKRCGGVPARCCDPECGPLCRWPEDRPWIKQP